MEDGMLAALRELYGEADRETAAFAAAAGLSCPAGCGACCHSTEVEFSLLEALLVIAAERRRADWPERLALVERARAAGQRICAFFEPDPLVQGNGRCGVYATRGLVCRLFGFAGRRDRYGSPAPVICRVMRGSTIGQVQAIQEHIDTGLAMPLFEEYRMRAGALCSPGQARLHPVNEALWLAIEKLEIEASLGGAG